MAEAGNGRKEGTRRRHQRNLAIRWLVYDFTPTGTLGLIRRCDLIGPSIVKKETQGPR